MIEDDYIFVQRLEKLIQKLPEIGPKQGLTQEEIDETIRKSKEYIDNYYNTRQKLNDQNANKEQLINAFGSLMTNQQSSLDSDN
jgi:predicted oxidoreductase